MKYSRLFFGFLSAFYILCASAFAQDFSADIISTAENKSFLGKIFSSQDKVRMEMSEAINIIRPDKGLIWMIMPKQKLYMEMPLDQKNMMVGTAKIPNEQTRELVGKENIDGKVVSKYKVVYDAGQKKETVYIWILEDLDIPVKTESADGSWKIEYKNIKKGEIPQHLFDIPSGYQKFSMNSPEMSDLGKMLDK
jgi:hypothetical protein